MEAELSPYTKVFELFIYLLTIAITPGPNTISSMANAAEKGLKGITFNLGMLLGIGMISSISFLLISFLSKYVPLLSLFLQILGIAYLIFLGIKMIKKRGSQKEKTGTFFDGFVMQVMNVKVLMLCVTAISEYIIIPEIGKIEQWIRVLMIPITCFICGLIWAVAGSVLQGVYERKRKAFNLIFALTLFLLAAKNTLKLFL